ncbi:hypothetical protein A2856_00345 [Candidatus Uhrbacteria bacterium RIFCSPHIGHO2_01_FULL_63_20]|uniref:Uncharacterized protein n=1 Tax=Candidatus Uhrbacteria bacterium RIFCSPHIGHO2_01_FULL_63_20 TaxID=1802385 RepID=A0A1F7TLS9_9BACT|nr:MAG: hypothetical protein A2856_00345 [Candidatus Uhrbacteria bacterium RIFCSPHIGHO2_01_FULL_63_20]
MDMSFTSHEAKLVRLSGAVVRASLAALFFLTPVFFLPWTSDALEINKQTLLILLLALGLMAWLGGMVMQKKWSVRPSWLYALGAGALAGVAVSSALSAGGYQGWVGQGGQEYASFLSLLAFGLLFVLLAHAAADTKTQRLLLLALLASGFVAGLIAILLVLGVPLPGIGAARGFNTVGTVNALTVAVTVIALIGCAAFVVSDGSGGDPAPAGRAGLPLRALTVVNAGLALIFLLSTDFWVLWLLVIVGVLVMSAFLFLQARRFPHPQRFVLPLLLLAAAVVFVLPQIRSPLSLPFPSVISPTYGISMQIALDTLKEGKLSFLFGSGPGTFVEDYAKHRPVEINQSAFWSVRFDRAKSHAITSLATYGAIPFLLATAFFVLLGYAAVSRILKERDGEEWKMTFVFLVGWVTILLAHVLYASSMTQSFLLFALSGLLAAQALPTVKAVDFSTNPRFGLAGSFAFVVMLVGTLTGVGVVVQRYGAELAFASAVRMDRAGKPVEDVIAKLAEAVNRNPASDLYWRNLASAVLVQAGGLVSTMDPQSPKAEDTQKLQQLVSLSVTAASNATAIAPHQAGNWVVRGAIYRDLMSFVGNAEDFAAASFQEAINLEPASPSHQVDLARVHLAVADRARALTGNKDAEIARKAKEALPVELKAAEDALKAAVALKADYAPARYYLAVLAERNNKLADAAAGLAALTRQNPMDVGLSLELGLLYLRMKDAARAIVELERAKSVSPDNSNVMWFLASAYEVAGKRDQAIALVDRVRELNPGNEAVVKRLERMRAGELTTVLPGPVEEGEVKATEAPVTEPTAPPEEVQAETPAEPATP